MPSNKKRLAAAKLYLILDNQVLDDSALLKVLKISVRWGIDIVQLRNKNGSARDILTFCKHALKITRHHIPFIVNDRADLAILSGADGLHVGQDDLSYKDARKLLGSKKIIGVSCQKWEQVAQAQRAGADYVGFGSIFETKTKPDRKPMDQLLLQKVITKAKIPVFPIGGISRSNIESLTKLGVTKAAVCRDILLVKDAGRAVQELKEKLACAGVIQW